MPNRRSAAERLAPWLRLRVARLRRGTQRRRFAASVEVVDIHRGALIAAWSHDGEPLDHGLRVDLLCRLMSGRSRIVAVVVVRPGRHEIDRDDDQQWRAAACTAADIAGVDLAAVVVLSRWGWRDQLSGDHREWQRLRVRSGCGTVALDES